MARLKSPWSSPQNFPNTCQNIPVHAQLLRVSVTWVKGGNSGVDKQNAQVAKLIWGIPWNEFEFLEKAVQRGHPRAFDSLLPAELKKCSGS